MRHFKLTILFNKCVNKLTSKHPYFFKKIKNILLFLNEPLQFSRNRIEGFDIH